MLDGAGLRDCKIVVSGALDEYIIRDMLLQGARADVFAVGEGLITSETSPVFGGVYALSALERSGEVIPKIRLSENVTKITTPCVKRLWRLFDRASGKATADLVTLVDETVDETRPYELFDPNYTWKRKTVTDFYAKPLLEPLFRGGKLVAQPRELPEIRAYCRRQTATLWDEVLRFENPHTYYVDLSQALWEEKQRLLAAANT